ncbi:hypothetical protein ABZ412_05715 [Nocardia sp. NPDC005746]|uniref:hypothetical protein n=1 Tax=Nocardia sp. NPDC005746 TaxID=3157062 RepID=UPI0033F9936D
MSDSPHRDPADERAILAKLLSTNADVVAEVLRPGQGVPPPSVMAALRAARSLDGVVDDVLRSLVRQARDEGRTWAEIGEIFGTSRQAAFQRFGGAGAGIPIPPLHSTPPIPPVPTIPPMPGIPPMPSIPQMPSLPGMPEWPKGPGMPPAPGRPFAGPGHHGPHGHRGPGPHGPGNAPGPEPRDDEPGA